MTDREIDALVAEKVMGDAPGQALGPREYSADPAAALLVVEKVGWCSATYYERMTETQRWLVNLTTRGDTFNAHAETLPRAICLAALAALGVRVER